MPDYRARWPQMAYVHYCYRLLLGTCCEELSGAVVVELLLGEPAETTAVAMETDLKLTLISPIQLHQEHSYTINEESELLLVKNQGLAREIVAERKRAATYVAD